MQYAHIPLFSTNINAVDASYCISYHIAKNGKNHITGNVKTNHPKMDKRQLNSVPF